MAAHPDLETSESPAFASLREMITSHRVTQVLYVAAKFGLADCLKEGPRTVEELAQATRTHTASLGRLLRALAALGVFAEEPDGRFRLTSLSTHLLSDAPHSLRPSALYWGAPWMWAAWGNLDYSVETGDPAFDHVHQEDFWAYQRRNPDAAAVFNQFLAAVRPLWHTAIVSAYDFSGVRTLVDVGGGFGQLLVTILRAYPAMQGILFDQPDVISDARHWLARAGVLDRCQLVGGDFFTAVPDGGDIYVLSNIIHDWGDQQAIAILRSCRSVMRPANRLLVVERVVIPGNPSIPTLMGDLTMLALLRGGCERTESAFREIFNTAGFTLTERIPTAMGASILVGKPT